MAAVAAMMASTVTAHALSRRPASVTLSTGSRCPALRTRRFVQVRCMAEPEKAPDAPASVSTPASPSASSATPAASSVTPITSQANVTSKPKVSTRFEDIFAFSGPAPELINGRLAMLGFVGALAVELGTGTSFTDQLQNGGLGLGVFVAVLFTAASLIPMFQGVTAESKSKSFWSSQAEKVNGRLAMVGLVALAITEFVNGRPLV
ncbi:hypothetical protein Mapa_017194 [Marchantia paleacea]|nr:hypothetical protein Mapa_017194 [Marchantia paleacea]